MDELSQNEILDELEYHVAEARNALTNADLMIHAFALEDFSRLLVKAL